MNLIFATNNPNKVAEVKSIAPDPGAIISLKEANIGIEIDEPFHTLEENARHKARTIHRLTGQNCFSEDTGLVTDALNGEPGVRSARYAGEGNSSALNIEKLLRNLENKDNRSARFITIICLIFNGEEFIFEGRCEGKIAEKPSGNKGFGYDPVFIPDGASQTFAEMTMEEKNRFSHRKKAFDQFAAFLKKKSL